MKNHNKAFIIFSPAFPANETENWLTALQIFIKAVNKIFPKLEVIVFAFQYPYTTKRYQQNNTTVIPFNGMHKKKPARIIMWTQIFYEVIKIKKQRDVVGIFSQWCGECMFVAKYISTLLKLKSFCWILGQDARETNTYVKRIQPKPSSLIAISDFVAGQFYKSHSIMPLHVIPIGIDTTLFNSTSMIKDIDIIGVGSLSFLKQYDLFVEIVAAIKKDIPGIKAMICGDGEAREQIETMVKELSVSKNLTLTGTLQNAKVIQAMQKAKILLHPSNYEGFSSACLEALCAGAHVISFTKPMNHEIKNWHVVKTKDEMRLKILELLCLQDTQYESVVPYTIDDAAKKVLNLFEYESEY